MRMVCIKTVGNNHVLFTIASGKKKPPFTVYWIVILFGKQYSYLSKIRIGIGEILWWEGCLSST